MNRFYTVVLAIAILAVTVLVSRGPVYSRPVQGQEPSRKQYVDGRVIVKMKAGASSLSRDENLIADMTSRPERLASPAGQDFYVVRLGEQDDVEQAVARLQTDPRVEYAEPDYLWYPTDVLPNDPLYGLMWDLFYSGSDPMGGTHDTGIDTPRAWDITTGSDDIVVGVTDTGIDLTHNDLAPNAWVNPVDGSNGFNFADNNSMVYNPMADSVHGTHVAGTIGAVGNNGIAVTGVAWHVKLMALKFIGTDSTGASSGSTANAIAAINYAVDQKNKGVNIRVINASWDGGKNAQALHDAIAAAGNAGILFVCAAGNGDASGRGQDMDNPDNAVYPGAWTDIPTLISVAAVDQQDNLASFSNFGHTSVSVAAPGVGIFSTFPNNSLGSLSGTSMASPHVVGIAVLLVAHEPGLTAAQIKARILNSTVPIPSLASKVAVSGRVNAFNALMNQTAPVATLQVTGASATKKMLTVDGAGFQDAQSVIEINGAAQSPTIGDPGFVIPNGSTTRLSVFLGKPLMKQLIPAGTQVMITVFDPASGTRSAPFPFVR